MWGVCPHEWVEVSRSVAGPGAKVNIKNVSVKELQKILAGQTHVELLCRICGDVKSRTLAGRHPK